MSAVKIGQQLADLGTLGVAVGGAGRFDNGKLGLGGEITDVLFGHIDHGTDEMQIGAGKVSYRLKASKPSFKEQVEHEGIHYVVEMMSQSYAVASKLLCGIVKYAAAHFSTKRAGIGFLAHVENDFGDLGRGDVIRNLKSVAKCANGREIHGRGKAHINGDGAKIKFLWIKAAQVS